MAEAFAIIAMLGAAAALILFLDWVRRNLGEALKENPDTGSRGGGRNKRHQGLGTQHTSSVSHSGTRPL